MIKISDKAKLKILDIIKEDQLSGNILLRIRVNSGGCSGLSYDLKFDDCYSKDDKLFDYGSFKIVIDNKSFLYLAGLTLDYSGGLNGKGFIFNNPNAARTCGCGESFSI